MQLSRLANGNGNGKHVFKLMLSDLVREFVCRHHIIVKKLFLMHCRSCPPSYDDLFPAAQL